MMKITAQLEKLINQLDQISLYFGSWKLAK